MPTTFSTGLTLKEKPQIEKRERLLESFKIPLGLGLIDFGGFVELHFGVDPYLKVKFVPWPDEGILTQAKRVILSYGPFMILLDAPEKCLKLLIPFDKIDLFKAMKRPVKIARPEQVKKRKGNAPVVPTPLPPADPSIAASTDIQSQTLKSNTMEKSENSAHKQAPSEKLIELKSRVTKFLQSRKARYVSVVPRKTGDSCSANLSGADVDMVKLVKSLEEDQRQFVEQTGKSTLRFKIGFNPVINETEDQGNGSGVRKKPKGTKSSAKKPKVKNSGQTLTTLFDEISANLEACKKLSASRSSGSGYSAQEIWEILNKKAGSNNRIDVVHSTATQAPRMLSWKRKDIMALFGEK